MSHPTRCNECCTCVESSWKFCPTCGSKLETHEPKTCPTCKQDLPKRHGIISCYVTSVDVGEVSYAGGGPSWNGIYVTLHSDQLVDRHKVRVTPDNLEAIEYSLEHGTPLRAKLIPLTWKSGRYDEFLGSCYDSAYIQTEPHRIYTFKDFQIIG